MNFSLFPRLPRDCRIQIWEDAVPVNQLTLVKVQAGAWLHFYTDCQPLGLLQACFESRGVVQKLLPGYTHLIHRADCKSSGMQHPYRKVHIGHDHIIYLENILRLRPILEATTFTDFDIEYRFRHFSSSIRALAIRYEEGLRVAYSDPRRWATFDTCAFWW